MKFKLLAPVLRIRLERLCTHAHKSSDLVFLCASLSSSKLSSISWVHLEVITKPSRTFCGISTNWMLNKDAWPSGRCQISTSNKKISTGMFVGWCSTMFTLFLSKNCLRIQERETLRDKKVDFKSRIQLNSQTQPIGGGVKVLFICAPVNCSLVEYVFSFEALQ